MKTCPKDMIKKKTNILFQKKKRSLKIIQDMKEQHNLN